MPITYRHEPSAVTRGEIAYQGALGTFLQEERRASERNNLAWAQVEQQGQQFQQSLAQRQYALNAELMNNERNRQFQAARWNADAALDLEKLQLGAGIQLARDEMLFNQRQQLADEEYAFRAQQDQARYDQQNYMAELDARFELNERYPLTPEGERIRRKIDADQARWNQSRDDYAGMPDIIEGVDREFQQRYAEVEKMRARQPTMQDMMKQNAIYFKDGQMLGPEAAEGWGDATHVMLRQPAAGGGYRWELQQIDKGKNPEQIQLEQQKLQLDIQTKQAELENAQAIAKTNFIQDLIKSSGSASPEDIENYIQAWNIATGQGSQRRGDDIETTEYTPDYMENMPPGLSAEQQIAYGAAHADAFPLSRFDVDSVSNLTPHALSNIWNDLSRHERKQAAMAQLGQTPYVHHEETGGVLPYSTVKNVDRMVEQMISQYGSIDKMPTMQRYQFMGLVDLRRSLAKGVQE